MRLIKLAIPSAFERTLICRIVSYRIVTASNKRTESSKLARKNTQKTKPKLTHTKRNPNLSQKCTKCSRVCVSLCTKVVHNTAQSSSDYLPSYPSEKHQSSDAVYWRGGAYLECTEKLNTAYNRIKLKSSSIAEGPSTR